MASSPFSFTPPQQQQTPLFQSQQQQSPFTQQQQQQLQFFQQQQQQQPQPQLQQTQLFLFTNDNAPASYTTKWPDLHPHSQKLLLLIEERILEYRDESQRMDQCGRLYDSSVSNDGFELDATHIVQELGGISTAMDRQKTLLHELMSTVKDLLRNTEIAVRSFMILHPRFVHPNRNASSSSNAVVATSQTGSQQTATATAIVPVYDFYSGLPRKPSSFLQQTVCRFDKYLGECRQWIEELEQLLILESNRSSSSSLLQSLPKVMANVHDFFVHVAAKVESIHEYMESMKTAYLADQRCRGDGNDPFLEADRRETAKLAAAAKRVHPTLHLPPPAANSQPSSTQVATPSATVPPPTSGAGSGSTFFATPSAATSGGLSLFSTPTTSAPTTSLFGSSAAAASPPSSSLFGTFQTSTTTLTTPLFSSTPASGASSFSTPFATGAATGSGASFGALSKTRGKSRTGRR